MIDMPMKGRTALVTGASKGIGYAISANFAMAGASVALVARTGSTLGGAQSQIAKLAPGAKLVAIPADVSTAEGCKQAFEAAEKELGRIDVVVNNAGISAAKPFAEVTDEEWQDDLDLKLFGAIRLSRAVLPGMKARRWGRIINTLNTGAKAPPASGAPTAVTRAAGMALTKVLAGEGAKHNVLVNAVLVGRIESDQWVQRAKNAGKDVSQIYQEMSDVVPMGRIGTAEEFANIVTMLASDQGSYVTGTAINIDGGMSPVV